MKKERYMQVHLVQAMYTRRFIEQKERICIHALSQKEKCIHVGKLSFWSEVFGPRYFDPRYLVRGIDLRYLVQGIGLKWFCSMVLRKA